MRPKDDLGSAPRMMFSATVKDGASLKCWCTMPIPGGDRLGRPGEVDRAAAQLDRARVARQQSVEDVHQRRLAGAVLADQGVDLALAHGHRGIVDGDEVAEPLDQRLDPDDVAPDDGHVGAASRAIAFEVAALLPRESPAGK